MTAKPLLIHITGARPNFPKAAPVIAAMEHHPVRQMLVHTGQHYDARMSEVFFAQLGLPEPDVNLGVGSGSHATQTAAIMVGLEELFAREHPDLVVVYGDVNSTVAAALVAAKMGIPVAHVEAGLRSFDMTMPEEINRLLTDRLSNLLLVTSVDAIAHLGREGADAAAIHFVGNPMIDTLLQHVDSLDSESVAGQVGVDCSQPYVVGTLHRPGNVDDVTNVRELVRAVHSVADQVRFVIPLHPRGRARLEDAGFMNHHNVTVVDPLGYVEFLALVRGAAAVVTDSGGVQEETTVLGVPCLTLRPNTERPVTITHGTNQLVTRQSLPSVLAEVLATGRQATWPVPPLWDGEAGPRIADVLARHLGVVS
ncbi:non-hydrolyzing UDP-N-acetylglucosamine 2-epimerase [Ornithinimicrobium panacihumi]|uniref:non-hydrolyzing UDP-N-acetylglucosamine 2-epimerase n=1 Tax=Ornithinimicrobium panacihumi TaxID=2008449 RepID=UPI003F8887ED